MPIKELKKVLIIDDNHLFRESLKTFLEKHRYEVTSHVSKIKEAILSIQDNQPDVLLLDLVLPGQDTLKFIQYMKKNHPLVSLIVCSSLQEEHVVAQILETHCFDYIFKPFKEKRLLLSLESVFQKIETEEQVA